MNRIRKKKGGHAETEKKSDGSTVPKKKDADLTYKMDKPSGNVAFTEQDIEFMKKAIQVLCQSTNPLGKSIDFVTDDIDSMNKEFEYWKKESSQCQSQLAD